MKILIVEDEPLVIQRISKIIKDNKPEWEVVSTVQSVKELNQILDDKFQFDLMLCDIHLADGLSFKAFANRKISFPIIFITAYDQYALQSFDHNCIDYVLKPIQEERLLKAFEKAESLIKNYIPKLFNQELINDLLNKYKEKSYKKRFLTKLGNKIRFVSGEDVAYFYTEDGISYLVEKGSNKKNIIEQSLNELEQELLDPTKFYRINRSIIIHLDGLVDMKPYFNGRLLLSMNAMIDNEIIVAREKVNEFKSWLNQ
ncbi:LytTR family DNA-binding domain-containing protein [Aquiflexum sp. LQ15W]|uniref:LytR/AlgR family response regulator transcription factor n=1 Tax=Cognataquiflexum nitidum TaxID=2922272 RepID=UPI001F148DBB|nr:LytTR family DNA-binding domain-containing protein [Cognataquiflexum nitidum]MCH6199559.1 LytTR family DNA-binding domain-containing protein [Cognataquiflexum nitidum]